jgi:hypothetical protein
MTYAPLENLAEDQNLDDLSETSCFDCRTINFFLKKSLR